MNRNAFPAVVAVSLVWLLAVVIVACSSPADAMAVDTCLLKEYQDECETEMLTPEEQVTCKAKAAQEATRLLAGIPAACRAA